MSTPFGTRSITLRRSRRESQSARKLARSSSCWRERSSIAQRAPRADFTVRCARAGAVERCVTRAGGKALEQLGEDIPVDPPRFVDPLEPEEPFGEARERDLLPRARVA